jgi:hypothetical protein
LVGIYVGEEVGYGASYRYLAITDRTHHVAEVVGEFVRFGAWMICYFWEQLETVWFGSNIVDFRDTFGKVDDFFARRVLFVPLKPRGLILLDYSRSVLFSKVLVLSLREGAPKVSNRTK